MHGNAKKKMIEIEERSWLHLPVELLEKIIILLCFKDCIRLSAVCLTMRSAVLTMVTHHPNRWPLLMLPNDDGECGILDLRSGKNYPMKVGEDFRGNRFLCSAHGWLLLINSNDSLPFFFHPFSKARINLPNLEVSNWNSCKFAFSCPPTSQECIVFFMEKLEDSSLGISTCHFGEENWTTRKYEHNLPSSYPGMLTFYNGLLYFLHVHDEHLRTFDASDGTYTVLKPKGVAHHRNKLLAVFSGELFLIDIITPSQIFKFDHRSMAWVEEEGLEDMMFCNFWWGTLAFMKPTENKICIPESICSRYLIDQQMLQTVNMTLFQGCYWSEPKCFHPFPGELKWGGQ